MQRLWIMLKKEKWKNGIDFKVCNATTNKLKLQIFDVSPKILLL